MAKKIYPNKSASSAKSGVKTEREPDKENLISRKPEPVSKHPVEVGFFPFLTEKMGLIILMLVSIIIYANTFTNEYALDDAIVLQKNTHVKEGFAGIKKILKREPFENAFGDELLRKRYYRQLSIVSFAVEHQFFGENPTVSHILNVLFYALLVGVMYVLLRRHFFQYKPDVAFFATLIFAVHPIHTEVVANIKSRDELFCLLFCLSSLYLAFNYYKSQTKPVLTLAGALFCYFLALLSKENAIVFWAVFPLSFFFFLGDDKEALRTTQRPFSTLLKTAVTDLKKVMLLSLPFVGMIALYFLFRAVAIGIDTAVEQSDKLHNRFYSLPFTEAFPTKVYFWLMYLKLLAFPDPLVWDYSFHSIPFINFGFPQFWITVLILGIIKVWGLWQIPYRNPVSFGIFFFLGTLFLVSGLIINIGGYFAERFLFQPSFGFAVAVGALFYGLLKIVREKNNALTYPLIGVFGVIILTGCAFTMKRNPDWKSNETLFAHDVQYQPNSALMQKAYGGVLLSKTATENDPQKKRAYRDQAYQHFYKAYQIYPQFADALINLGFIHYVNGEYPQAEKYWLELKRLYPTHPQLRENHDFILNKLLSLANDAFNRKDYDEYMKLSLRAYPFAAEVGKIPYHMGSVYWNIGQPDSSLKYLRLATSVAPNNDEYWFALGQICAKTHRIKEGKEALSNVLRLNPKHEQAQFLMRTAPPDSIEKRSSAPTNKYGY